METLTLRAMRVNLGLSLEQASTLIGISKDTLSSYERGRTFPDLSVIRRIEEVYGVRILSDTVKFLPNYSVQNGTKRRGGVTNGS